MSILFQLMTHESPVQRYIPSRLTDAAERERCDTMKIRPGEVRHVVAGIDGDRPEQGG
jgi:hypothetical protein